MNERPSDDRLDRQLTQFLAWFADGVAASASTEDAMAGRVVAHHRRRVGWLPPVRLRLLGVAAVLAAVLAAIVAASLFVGTQRREPIELAPPVPIVDLFTAQDGRELHPASYAVHGFRPPFAITLPATLTGRPWIACCGGPGGELLGLSEQPTGNLVFVMNVTGLVYGVTDAQLSEGRYCEAGLDGCMPAALDGTLQLPASYWVMTLDSPAGDLTVVVGADTRTELDDFLPRARAVIDSIDFHSSAITSSPPPGSEPLPLPASEASGFIGSQGFGRELRYIPADQAPPVVTIREATDIAAREFLEYLAYNKFPPEPTEPIGIVRRMLVTVSLRTQVPTELRSIWIVVFRTPDPRYSDAFLIDDQTGEVVGGALGSRSGQP